MLRTIVLTTVTLLAFSACGDKEDPPSKDEQRLRLIHEKAPSFFNAYSEEEAVVFMDRVCEEGALDYEAPPKVDMEDYTYVQGLALGSC